MLNPANGRVIRFSGFGMKPDARGVTTRFTIEPLALEVLAAVAPG
jgi:hypothetical protein